MIIIKVFASKYEYAQDYYIKKLMRNWIELMKKWIVCEEKWWMGKGNMNESTSAKMANMNESTSAIMALFLGLVAVSISFLISSFVRISLGSFFLFRLRVVFTSFASSPLCLRNMFISSNLNYSLPEKLSFSNQKVFRKCSFHLTLPF